MFSFEEFYIYRLVKVKVTDTQITKFKRVMKHCIQACSCIVLMFYATLGGPSWFLPLVKQKHFKAFLLILVVYFFRNPAWLFLISVMNVFYC